MPSRSLALVALVVLAACEPAPPDPQLVAQWIRTSQTLVRGEELGIPVASRVFAYSSLALYEAYAADPRSQLRSLAGQLNGLWSVPLAPSSQPIDGATAAAEVERVVLDSLFSAGSAGARRAIDSLARAQVASRRSAGVGKNLSDRSVAFGGALGRVVLAWAGSDGFFATRGRAWTPTTSGGQWVLVPGAVRGLPRSDPDPAVQLAGSDAADRARRDERSTLPRFSAARPAEPHWGRLRTFALRNGDECAPPPPFAYAEWRGSDFWKMGKQLYDSASSLTPEQRDLEAFWTDAPDMPGAWGLHWIDVTTGAIARHRLAADEAAELYALTATAMADGLIGAWKEKYRSLVLRPATFVHRAIDARWAVPPAAAPWPAYPSERGVLASAAAGVLVRLLGDTLAYSDTNPDANGVRARAFRNFTHARDEAAASAIYGGVDFVPAVVEGLAQGQCVAARVLGRLRTRPADQ